MGERKYYWLKLKDDFFKRHDIKIIEAMDNGKEYVLLYLKLLVESVSHNGRLRFSDEIPYSEKMLATITGTNVDVLRAAMQTLRELRLVDVLEDGTLFLPEVANMTGSESSSAERARRSRQKAKALQCNTNVTPKCDNVQNCNTEKERELKSELELEPEQEGECANAQNSSLSPSREQLVEEFGAHNVRLYEQKFKAWQKKEKGRESLDLFLWIKRWMLEDGVKKSTNTSSFDTDNLMIRIMEKYKKGK